MNSLMKDVLLKNKTIFNPVFIRQFRTKGCTIGTPPGEAPTIKQILQKRREKDETLYYKVDIGLPFSLKKRVQELAARQKHIESNKKNSKLEKLSRNNELLIPLDEVFNEWKKTDGPAHIKRIAEHYGVFESLFGDAFFYPVSPLSIAYKVGQDEYAPVYFGNQIKPREANTAPVVEIESKADTYHTLVLCNLDGHLNTEGLEYVHWFVGNIPDGDITKGETIYDYLQPFPTKGTGYHRLVFVLYEQTQKLDYSTVPNKEISKAKVNSRNFNTYDFYKDRQDIITPVGLRFFQSDWDTSVTKIFHYVFKLPEPRYEFCFPKNKVNPQKWFPIDQPFNVYMDRYRDPKEISKEVLLKKLKTHHPFKKPDPPLKYPHAHSLHDCQDKPSWLQVEIKKERLGWGKRVNDNLDILHPEKM